MLGEFNWMHIVGSSWIVMVLIGFSVITLGIVIERALYYMKRKDKPEKAFAAALSKLRRGQKAEAVRVCEACNHPMGAVAAQILESESRDPEEAEERLQIALSQQKLFLERNLGILGTMAAVAPLVGLFGTVWGIMRAFRDMGTTGSAAPSVVAAGVAEALVTTAVGLMIAVPALMLYNHFSRRMGVMLTEAENNARSLRLALFDGASGAAARRNAEDTIETTNNRAAKETVEELEAVMAE
ncbi:MAG TPA: MotA/TolQ/ExbB proton channel family protein [Candidatus Eisenbacteria bacterium]|uniref:MotA/TolQ/ExbB proton channel family protein n=1 Tax=Eiseniibacteriota bacterium TaxID=2212470 RepID=A0A7V2AUY3_UNCEI|nr:MotA/TolQ/ExbB proton channel family protein [Candidatus Eisenbacteria bacterium]